MKNIIKWVLPIAGLLVVTLGGFLIFRGFSIGEGEYALDGMYIFIAIALILLGISEIAAFIKKEDKSKAKPMALIGVTAIVLGVFVLIGDGMQIIKIGLPIAFAVWIITASLLRIQSAWESKKKGSPWWVFLISFGCLGVALGIFMLIATFLVDFIVVYALAFIFIIHGIHDIFVFFPRNEKPKVSE